MTTEATQAAATATTTPATAAGQPAAVAEPGQPSKAGRLLAIGIIVLMAVGIFVAFNAAKKPVGPQAATPPSAGASADLAAAAAATQTQQAQWWASHQTWDGYAPAPTPPVRVTMAYVAGGDYLASAVISPGAATCKVWAVARGVPGAPADAPAASCTQEAMASAAAAQAGGAPVTFLKLTPETPASPAAPAAPATR